MFKASKSRKRQASSPKYKTSASGRTRRERNKNSMNWSGAFLLKIAGKEAGKWQRQLARERAAAAF